MKNPIHPKIKTEIIPGIIILSTIIASFFFYRNFPEVVATHWNFAGEADGFSSPAFAAFFFPGMILGIYLLLIFVPLIDPKKSRYEQFAKTYRIFRNLIIFLMGLVYFVSGFANIGYNVNVGAWVTTAIGVMFIVMGNYMGKLKNNWFIGIRTPWTLSSENVWNKTHRFSGKLFMVSGVLMIVTGYAPLIFRLPALIAAVSLLVFGSTIYSYIIYLKEKKKK